MPIHESAALLFILLEEALTKQLQIITLEGSLSGAWIGMLIAGCYLSSGPSA